MSIHHPHEHSGHSHHDILGEVQPTRNHSRSFLWGIVLNVLVVVVQVAMGLYAGSLALLADAGHNLSDVLGLALAWGAMLLARREPTPRHTYGLRRSTILAALANAMLVLLAVGAIAWEPYCDHVQPSASWFINIKRQHVEKIIRNPVFQFANVFLENAWVTQWIRYES